MKILIAHNKYKQVGGEDIVFESEVNLLRDRGIDVATEIICNDKLLSLPSRIGAAILTPYSPFSKKRFGNLIDRERPDIVHVHNFFPQFSPSIFSAAKSRNTPTVFTLHNYRIICPTAILMHNGKITNRSIESGPFWAIPKRVYKNSYIGTASIAAMIALNKAIGTWQKHVDCFIALTEFSKSKFIQAGLPADKITVKSNFVDDPHNGDADVSKRGGYALYVGRLSEEKGIRTMLEAWKGIDYPLIVVGDGPLSYLLTQPENRRVEALGFRPRDEVQTLLQHADFLLMPSECYEGFPMSLLEAYANGTPAIASQIGSLKEIVIDHHTGLHFEPGDAQDLRRKAAALIEDDALRRALAKNARTSYLDRYTPQRNLEALMSIYRRITDTSGQSPD